MGRMSARYVAKKVGMSAEWVYGMWKDMGLIYPDFISRNSEMRIIADAKYKPIDNIGNRDYLQVLAYMFRFEAQTGYYLYPEAGDSDALKLHMNRGSTYEKNVSPRDDICIIKHGLKIPMDVLDYFDFVSRMEISEKVFINAFMNCGDGAENTGKMRLSLG